jgi:pimeloyl-ACP methyl ester carboxylesterase
MSNLSFEPAKAPICKRFMVLILFVCCLGLPVGRASAESFEAKGVRLHYTIEGKGEPVVLIHGLNSSSRLNWGRPGVISLLSKNYQVIALDMPGHGESDKPETEEAYGDELVEDVVRLLDHLKIRRAHIVGYSMGGMIAMKLMARHQDRVISGLVCGMGWLQEGSIFQRFWGRLPAREGARVPPACARSLGELALSESEVRKITVPVQIIVGDRDPVKPFFVDSLARVRTDWPVVEIADAGHLSCVMKPQFKESIAEWLLKKTQSPR